MANDVGDQSRQIPVLTLHGSRGEELKPLRHAGDVRYEFFQGDERICMINPDPPAVTRKPDLVDGPIHLPLGRDSPWNINPVVFRRGNNPCDVIVDIPRDRFGDLSYFCSYLAEAHKDFGIRALARVSQIDSGSDCVKPAPPIAFRRSRVNRQGTNRGIVADRQGTEAILGDAEGPLTARCDQTESGLDACMLCRCRAHAAYVSLTKASAAPMTSRVRPCWM